MVSASSVLFLQQSGHCQRVKCWCCNVHVQIIKSLWALKPDDLEFGHSSIFGLCIPHVEHGQNM
jgi:hypothetical protein